MRPTYRPGESTVTRVIRLLCAMCLVLGGCRAGEDVPSNPLMLSGRWRAHHVDPGGKEIDYKLVFQDRNQFTLDGIMRFAEDNLDYPLPIWRFEYKSVEEDRWSATLLSKLVEGKEHITPEEAKPGQHTLRRLAETELILESPRRTTHFHPIAP